MGTSPKTPSGLRADAKRNKAHILDVARETFGRDGLEVSMAEIARRSGVGIATMFRHFPSKDQLVSEVITAPILECAESIDSALAPGEALATFESVTEGICELQTRDIGFALVLVSRFSTEPALSKAVARMSDSIQRLIAQAKADGHVRADLALDDFIALLTANAGIVALSGPEVESLSRRLVSNMLRSFRRS